MTQKSEASDRGCTHFDHDTLIYAIELGNEDNWWGMYDFLSDKWKTYIGQEEVLCPLIEFETSEAMTKKRVKALVQSMTEAGFKPNVDFRVYELINQTAALM